MKRKTRRTRQLALHLERLEDRYLMNGDPAPVIAIWQPDTAAIDLVDVITIDRVIDFPRIIDWMPPWNRPVTESPASDPLFESVDQIPDWLIDEIDKQFGKLFGSTQSGYGGGWYDYDNLSVGNVVLRLAAMTADASTGSTNTQVEGVDEADLVETDGEFIYVITGNELVIVDARDSENLSIASRVRLNERPTGMYLSGNRLTLISTNEDHPANDFGGALFMDTWYRGGWGQPAKTTVTVLDVTDRAAPTQVQKTELNGKLVSSRMVDGELRLVVQQESANLLDHLPEVDFTNNFDAATQSYSTTYESRESYLSRLQKTLSKSIVPTYRTIDVAGEVINEESLIPLDEILHTGGGRRGTATTIVVFDTLGNDTGPAATKTVTTADAAVVYATEDNLYVIGRGSQNNASWSNWSDKSTIWKFGFDTEDHAINLAASGEVEGEAFNQFAVDEHEGYLRVVMSDGWSDQSLFVLAQEGNQLNVVGSVESLAPGESLRSVRFMGDRAFVVTFEIVDPLFAIDLTNPTDPQIMGELKIPGFSEYLLPIDANHLIGIGRGSSEQFQTLEELQVTLFDVSDLDDPRLLHRYSFGGDLTTATIVTGDRWTQGDGDHHALSYFAEEQLLALPIYTAEHMNWHGIDNTPLFEAGEGGLQLFHVDPTTGLTTVALIEHDSPILRSLRFDDKLVAISAGTITVHSFDDPATVLEELDIAAGTDSEFTALTSYVSMTLSTAAGTHVFGDGSWLPAQSLTTAWSQSLFEVEDSQSQSFDYLFAEQSHPHLDAAQPTSSRDRAFDSFFVPVSRSVRAVAEDVAGELAEELAEAVE